MTSGQYTEALQEILDRACADDSLQGASLAVAADGASFACTAGMANKPEAVPVTPETLFHIGSVTKAITAEMTWRLILDGRLTADMPVIDAAPELAHIESVSNRRLTIAHLLGHTGGLDGDVVFEAGRGKDVLRRFMLAIDTIPALSSPGQHFSYANVAYNILGRILELRGGSVFEEALGGMLRGFHGVEHVAILPEEKIRHRTAVHFSQVDGHWKPSYGGPYSNIASGTVLAMSMPDLARWGRSLLRQTDIVEQMCEPAVALPFNFRYEGWGHGVLLLDGMGKVLFGHDGGAEGTSTFLRIAPGARSAWAFAATGHSALSVYRQLEPVLRDRLQLPAAPKREPPGEPPADLDAYEGRYERLGMRFDINNRGDGTLQLSASGDASPDILDGLTLRPLNDYIFAAKLEALGAETWVSFHEFDDQARPHLFFVIERMARRHGTRVE